VTSRVRKAVDWTVGIGLITVGVVAGFVPVVQGWIFVLMGLAVLSSHSPWARRQYERMKKASRHLRERVASGRGRRR